jgi:hypothetical protein
MEFSNNFYVAVKDKVTGQGAFELVINRYTGFVHPEPQSMMWNTAYGSMTGRGGCGYGKMGPAQGPGVTGPGYGSPSILAKIRTSPMSLAQARSQAQKFLDAQLPGTKTDEAITFPGYYTLDVVKEGKPMGMLSVNAYTGQVWYHTWHGAFLQERDLD